MDEDDSSHDAFRTDNFWKSSSFFQDPTTLESSLFAPIQLDVSAIKLEHPYAPKASLERELQLPDLETFEFGLLPELESLDLEESSLDTPPLPEDDEDLWKVALDLGPANSEVQFWDWELFENGWRAERRTPYITEAGPAVFDAALASNEQSDSAGKVLRGNVLLASLWNLGLGRSSMLFDWNPKLRSFVPAIADGRASGLSPVLAKSFSSRFVLFGNTFVYLRTFIERTFASPASISARVALATCVSTILSTFEDHLGRHSNSIRSLLQLQRLFQRPGDILLHVARIVDMVKHERTNERLASTLYHHVLQLEEGDGTLCQLSAEILHRVSAPSLELLGEWIGIQKEQDTLPVEQRNSFVVLETDSDEQRPAEYAYDADAMPAFVHREDGNTIFETGNGLRFLRRHHPDHPLTSLEKYGVEAPKLEWRFDWQGIESIAARARAYEEDLRNAIFKYGNRSQDLPVDDAEGNDTITAEYGDTQPERDFAKEIEESARLFDEAPAHSSTALPDELHTLTTQLLSNTLSFNLSTNQSFSPPLSLTSAMSLRPLLTAQARLVNAASLRLFFRSHRLRMHLSLQRQYHLLGDGVFSSRLASALFDPERESAERQKGQMRSGVHMGLQVGSRENWPPASSELRLALMGVLSESFYTSALYAQTVTSSPSSDLLAMKSRNELPGQLNFAIRQLSPPEIEQIKDPDSLYALDFLRLQYMPSSPLHLIFTPPILEKYDAIFKFLLRLLRMLFVISHLPRTYPDLASRLFRTEAHHFIAALSTYIFQTGIAEPWNVFEAYVERVERGLDEEDGRGELGGRVRAGLEDVRRAQEECLEGIMFAVLLRRRQRKVMSLLEDIFGKVLRFAKVVREDNAQEHGDAQRGRDSSAREAEIRDLYAGLKGKIRVFISVCRGLTGRRGYGKGRGTTEENTLERLAVLLEGNAYYEGGAG